MRQAIVAKCVTPTTASNTSRNSISSSSRRPSPKRANKIRSPSVRRKRRRRTEGSTMTSRCHADGWNAIKGLIHQEDVETLCMNLCASAEDAAKHLHVDDNGETAADVSTSAAFANIGVTEEKTKKNPTATDAADDFLTCAEDSAISPRINVRRMGGKYDVFSRQEAAVLSRLFDWLGEVIDAGTEHARVATGEDESGGI